MEALSGVLSSDRAVFEGREVLALLNVAAVAAVTASAVDVALEEEGSTSMLVDKLLLERVLTSVERAFA